MPAEQYNVFFDNITSCFDVLLTLFSFKVLLVWQKFGYFWLTLSFILHGILRLISVLEVKINKIKYVATLVPLSVQRNGSRKSFPRQDIFSFKSLQIWYRFKDNLMLIIFRKEQSSYLQVVKSYSGSKYIHFL